MRITLSVTGLLLAANLPFVLRLVRYRRQLPVHWQSGLVIMLRFKLLSALSFTAQVVILPIAALYYLYQHLTPRLTMQFLTTCLINLLTFIVFSGHKAAYFLHINDWPVWVYKVRRWWRLNRATQLTIIKHRTLLLLFLLMVVYLINVLP